MPDKCKGPECERPAKTAGYCGAHYQQSQRGELKPLREGDRDQLLTLKVSKTEKKEIEAHAKRAGWTVSDWIRSAIANMIYKSR